MVDDETTTRRKLIRHTACFTPIENALLMTRVDIAGVSISAFLKSSALEFPLPRAARRPTSSHEDVACLIGHLGRLATAFREASDSEAAAYIRAQDIETAMHDLSELRLLCLRALGRRP